MSPQLCSFHFQLDVSFCNHVHISGSAVLSLAARGFVGDSRWYRVSFPITGPSYLSNTLCSVESRSISAVQGRNICEVAILRIAGDEYWQAYICRFELERNFNNRLV